MLYRDYAKDKYQNAFQLSNAEGVPCVLKSSKGKKMRNYEVYGNSVQDGTPSPENPVEIQSVGDLTTKNLLPNDWENGFINTNTGVNQYSTTFIRTKDYFTLDISKNYYISSNNLNTNNVIYWYFYDENKSYVSSFVSRNNRTVGISGQAVRIPENTAFYRLSIDTTDTTIKVQIEEGSTATEYEPYHKYDIPITVAGTRSETTHIYLDEPLRKIGDYADYIDFKNQKVFRNVEVLDDTGTKTISESFGMLATPTEESIALPALKTFKDTNLISVDSTISSSNIKAKYIKK